MGLFDRVARTIGKLGRPVRDAAEAAEGEAGYACVACHSTFDVQHKQCPSCGSKLVVETDNVDRESNERVPW